MRLGVIGGAGLLGSTSAYLAGMKGYLDEIKLVDIKENLAKCHVMDMGQAFAAFSKTKVSYAEYKDLGDCDIILIPFPSMCCTKPFTHFRHFQNSLYMFNL